MSDIREDLGAGARTREGSVDLALRRHGVTPEGLSADATARVLRAFGRDESWSIVDYDLVRDVCPLEPGWSDKTLARYGLSRWDYEELRREQDDCCGVCERPTSSIGEHLVIDHCHVTGIVRGLLCRQCNVALGLLQERTDFATGAFRYLMRHLPPATAEEIEAVRSVLGEGVAA